MSTLLDDLRAATRPMHARLEAAVGMGGPDVDAAGYGRYLARLFGYHAPLEQALLAAPQPPGLDLAARAKTHLLRADLAALGRGEPEIDALPRCRELPRLDSAPRVLGVAYVVEGSTLGGAYLHRQLAAVLPDVAARASRFLRPYGDGRATGERWRAFLAALEAAPPEAGAEVVAGAVDTFDGMHAWFTAPAPGPRARAVPA